MIKEIYNFLPEKEYQDLKKIIFDEYLPWFLIKDAVNDNDNFCFFNHYFYVDGKVNSNNFEKIIVPILNNIKDIKKLIRVKANLYVNNGKKEVSPYHTDQFTPHKVCLFSFNTNNGYTEIKQKNELNYISKSEDNKALIFEGSLEHRACKQNDTLLRLNININYLNES